LELILASFGAKICLRIFVLTAESLVFLTAPFTFLHAKNTFSKVNNFDFFLILRKIKSELIGLPVVVHGCIPYDMQLEFLWWSTKNQLDAFTTLKIFQKTS